jgi:hypothetical protein
METYDEERKQLFDWLMKKSIEYCRTPSSGGLDGEACMQHQEDIRTYNRKLLELKEKYGIEDNQT